MEITITTSNFDAEVLASDIPVLVDFYADWCGPCKMIAPIVEQISEEYAGKIKVGKCNIDNDADIAMKYSIMSIPTIMIFKNGEAALTSIGALSKDDLKAKIDSIL